ncbi:TetR/AcrR family transcriptional regulator [Streptomyces sp. NY05-11A]|uniref:TetR/AcrR family transcriptional regulator n=1 Tax=Streptomyces soliscabiei TaxID=588897 RepID=UPI0029A5B31E|nr:TetR/AcrR family transcriptional regulator [Streptomyces sp. NY05-11A]MDX2681154.1 TetR/AcrR family transcriptional regulator [Streptomyces sp. NY05-11A]
MAKEHGGTSDPAHILELLWREPRAEQTRRGPRQGLSVDAVVRVAVELADSDGLEALTMRGIARRLGVTPMTLYTYVPGKAELLDLMLDAVYLRMPRSARPAASWRSRVEAVAQENRDLFRRHPWVATMSTARPPLGPGLMTKYEHELGAFEGSGLGDVERDAALTLILDLVRSVARAALDIQAAARDSAMSDQQWRVANEPLLAKVFDPARFPLAVRIGSAAGEAHQGMHNPDHAFTFGLQRILDGLACLGDHRSAFS